MPTFRVTAPDGKTYDVTGPDGSTAEQALAQVQAHLGGGAKSKVDNDEISKSARGFADEMSPGQLGLAGVGKAMTDLVRGTGQWMGAVTRKDVADARRLEAPLMATTAGKVGDIAGNLAMLAPTALIPGANTLTGAATVGGVAGLLQPSTSTGETLMNAGLGTVAAPAAIMLGRGLQAGYQGAKALVEPFTEAGRTRIAGRMIERFADNPAAVASATSKPTITGARPTLAEQTGDVGIARLQDSLRAADPQFNNQITARLAENNAARADALSGLAGAPGERAALEAAREKVAGTMYRKAFVRPGLKLNAAGEKEVAALMDMPAIQDAMKAAQKIAANKGVNIDNPAGSAEGLHYMKMALDDAYSAAGGGGGTGAQKNAAAGIKAAQQRLVAFLEDLRPDYKNARQTYAKMSKPINALDIGEELARRGLSNTSDLAGNPRMQANALMGALRDEPALIRRATGRGDYNALSDVMDPARLNLLRNVADETDRAAAVAAAGNGPGSATAQRMASQNVLRQILGPTGLPQSWSENALANTVVGKPLNLIYGGIAEPKIQQQLAKAILSPDEARAALDAAMKANVRLPPTVLQKLTAEAVRSGSTALAVSRER